MGIKSVVCTFCVLIVFQASCSYAVVNKAVARAPAAVGPLLEEDGDREIVAKDSVGIYNNADATPLYDILQNAKNTIDIEIYEMYDKTFLEVLNKALDRGVVVRLIKDPTPVGGDKCHLFPEYEHSKKKSSESEVSAKDDSHNCDLQKEIKKKIESLKGAVKAFNKPVLCGREEHKNAQCFEHGKMVIIDRESAEDRRALVSTGNFNASNLCNLKVNPQKCNRDYSYITRDSEAIAALEKVFESDLKGVHADLTPIHEKVTVSPYSLEPLSAFIESATKFVQIENQYMNDPQLNEAVKRVAQKPGVKVVMQVSNLTEFGRLKPGKIKNLCALFKSFKEAGVEVRIFTPRMTIQGKLGYLHAKAIVIDKEKAWIGSINGSTTSLRENREFGIFFNNKKRVNYLSEILSSDFHHEFSERWDQQVNCPE